MMMNYIKELNAFQDWLLFNNLPTGANCLWRTLLSINNATGWKKQFNAPNSTVYQLTGLNEDSHELARNQLVDRGLIVYKPGTKKAAPVYEMIPFCRNQETISGPSSPSSQETMSDIPKKKQNRGGGNPFQIYEENFGILKPILRDSLIAWCEELGDELVIAAIKQAARKGGRTFSYLEAILKEWTDAGVTDPVQAESYEQQKSKQQAKTVPFRKQKQSRKDALFNELRKEGSS